MNKLPKAWKWIIGLWMVILLATLAFKYFTDWRYPVPVDSPVIISLSKNPSLWGSPAYRLTVYGDGTVVYEGVMLVGAVGIRKTKIDATQVTELAYKIEQSGFFELEDKYYPGVYDAGSVTVFAKIGQKEKTVVRIDPGFIVHDLEIPADLFRVEDAITATVNPDQWVECIITSRRFRRLCGISPLALAAGVTIFGLTLWMIWGFIQRRKTWLGILLGFGIIYVQGTIAWNANWSFPTDLFSGLFVAFEVVAFLPASLILVWWHKRKTKNTRC